VLGHDVGSRGGFENVVLCYELLMFYFCIQLEFSDDIVKIIQAAINSDGGQPEIKKANSMVKSFFIRVNEINSSCF
jgi:hypothetical protein